LRTRQLSLRLSHGRLRQSAAILLILDAVESQLQRRLVRVIGRLERFFWRFFRRFVELAGQLRGWHAFGGRFEWLFHARHALVLIFHERLVRRSVRRREWL
jgi:hypothetical protein